MQQPTISIVVPAYNEDPVIEMTHRRLSDVMQASGESYEIIYVDDGSRDNTLPILKRIADADAHVVVLSFSRNFGQQAANTAGLRQSRGRAVVLIDADLQDPPEVIPEMIQKWRSGADVVYGVRKSRKGESLFKKITSWGYYRVFKFLSNSNAPLDTGDFRLMDRSVVDVLNGMSEHNRYIRGIVNWVGFTQVPVEFVREERAAGETKYDLKRMLSLANDGIVGFSMKPLTMAWRLGLIVLLGTLGYFIWQLVRAIGGQLVTGMALAMGGVYLLIAVILILLGLMGSYIGRIYEEAKARPLYIIDETYSKEGFIDG
ncbi:glycosyltransferase family 2 protein [Eubacteriales bacterium OttesenSCG-928-N14]|nr:glycosyltransferase family 2 protein [Eubacteriales bacterium OttesenSCG-928-N14]